MGLTNQDRETIREEEIARWYIRRELKRKKAAAFDNRYRLGTLVDGFGGAVYIPTIF
jgi:hypothetical protein